MKKFKQILNEIACEATNDEDDMSARELQVAINAAQEILSMIKSGAELERWNESKITLASDYLVSVCTYMKTSHSEDDEGEEADQSPEYVGHEYMHLQPAFSFMLKGMNEEKKASKAEAKYQDRPKKGQRCVNCTMWREPDKCTAVSGIISKNGWCEWFEKDTK